MVLITYHQQKILKREDWPFWKAVSTLGKPFYTYSLILGMTLKSNWEQQTTRIMYFTGPRDMLRVLIFSPVKNYMGLASLTSHYSDGDTGS